MGTFILIIYLILGCVLTRHWWCKYHKEEYNKAKAKGEVNDSIVILYWLFSIVLWPIIMIINKRNINNFE